MEKCDKCGSENIKIVKYVIANGKIQYRHQCFNCGYVSPFSIKYNLVPANVDIPLLDEDLRNWCYSNSEVIAKSNGFDFSSLNEYYESKEWKIRRQHRLAFNKKFFNGKCERCGMNDAKVVHHRSYRLLGGKEHAFDLECLCEDCHALIHPHMRKGEVE